LNIIADMDPPAKKPRTNNTVVVCPIVYGSAAFYLGKKGKGGETSTHRWTLFVRGPNDEDLSTFVSKIAFSLHESFAEPVRIVDKPPFEVTELGWGEFAAKIRVFFKDPEEQPIDLAHTIKLYPDSMGMGAPQSAQQQQALQSTMKKPVMSERYDEVVFTEPTEKFRGMLMSYVPPKVRPMSDMSDHYTQFDEDKDVIALSAAQAHLTRELQLAKSKLLALEAEIASKQIM
jgi:YEATS domain-containing protein 4